MRRLEAGVPGFGRDTCRRINRAGPRPRLCAVGCQDSRQRHGPLGCPKRTPPNPLALAPADAALATRASSRAPARSSLDDVDQLLDGRWRPGDDEAIGGVAGDDPNLGRRDPPEGIRHFAPANAYSRGTSLTVTSSGASRSAGTIHMPPAVLTRRYPCTARAAFRSSSASAGETSSKYHPPSDLSGVEEKRESCEPAV
jgi:hypothetical protein